MQFNLCNYMCILQDKLFDFFLYNRVIYSHAINKFYIIEFIVYYRYHINIIHCINIICCIKIEYCFLFYITVFNNISIAEDTAPVYVINYYNINNSSFATQQIKAVRTPFHLFSLSFKH